MILEFTIFSNGEISSDIQLYRNAGFDEYGFYIKGMSEKLSVGYNIFETDFFNTTLKDIISQYSSEGFLSFLDSQYSIPKQIILYPIIDNKFVNERFNDMGLRFRRDLSFTEKLTYYQEHKNDFLKTFHYDCKTKRDIALSELHYYITQGYKLTYCNLCGKPFFTKNLKNKYCRRKGFDIQHPQYTCNKIRALQRNTKCASDEIKRIRKIIISTLERKSETERNEKAADFRREESEYKESHLPSEYEQWMKDKYKAICPNGTKLKATETN